LLGKRLSSPWAAAVLVAALVGLAALQYRWIGEISRAERERLGRGLESSASLLRRDFNREVQRLAEDFWIDPRTLDDPESAVLERFVRRSSRGGDLALADVYLRTLAEDGAPQVQRLNPETLEFESSSLPARTAALSNFAQRRRRGGAGGPGGGPGSGFGSGPGSGFGGARPGGWTFLPTGMLATSLLSVEIEAPGRRPRLESAAGLYLQLDLARLSEETFPELIRRYFGPEQSAHVAVYEREAPDARLLFSSTRDEAAPASITDAEIIVPLLWSREESGRETADRLRDRFGRVAENFLPPGPDEPPPPRGPEAERPRRGDDRGPNDRGPGARGPRGRRGGGERGERGERRDRREPRDDGRGRRSSFDSFPAVANVGRSGPGGWTLAVSTVAGSLDELVAQTRRRNLAVSFGVLLLLGAGLALVLVSTRRAQRLAEMQMEFVAGVSHELRTPLAVIRSAGENLAEGLVAEPQQIREYGALVRDQGRRLSEMVDQTLELAGAQSGKRTVTLEPVDLSEIVAEVFAQVDGAQSGNATVETDVPDGLPPAHADRASVRLALRNLLENAQKYAGQSGPIAVEASVEGDRVVLRVRDQGPGIAPDDVPHLFEPFYRGGRARAEQTRGAGLGLSLAHDAVQASGGKLTVESRLGQGSTFAIDLPIAQEPAP